MTGLRSAPVLLQRAVEALARDVAAGAGGVCQRSLVVEGVWAQLQGGILERAHLDELIDEVLGLSRQVLASLPDGRVVDVGRAAEKVVLTHRLSEAEVADATLDLSPDLAVLAAAAELDDGLHTGDGSPLRLRKRRRRRAGRAGATRTTTHLEGPAGWLEALGPHRLVAARTAGGFLALEIVDEEDLAAPPVELAQRLGELFDLANEGDGMPVPAAELQVLAAVDGRGLFGFPRAPFGELAEAAGFELDGDLVGRSGCWDQERVLSDLVSTIVRQDLSGDDTALLLDVLKAFDAWRGDRQGPPGPGLAERLRLHWAVAEAVLEELRRKEAGPEELAEFATALGGGAGAWLASRAAALGGDAEEAERLAGAALATDPAFGPAVAEAAWYAGDRGRARDAVNLLHRVRRHDDDELQALRRLVAASTRAVGRNEACPCGSGRKYKLCHLGRSEVPEGERVGWLLDKVAKYITELAPPELLDDVATTGDADPPSLGLDLLAFDDGWLERFLADRAPLLPEVERDWARQWVGGHVASVFRLCERNADGRSQLEDARTGVGYTVQPSPVFDDVALGRLVWTRLVPVAERWWTTGLARHTSLAERATLLAATEAGTTLARRLEALAPEPDGPRLQNTSGEPIVMCTTTVAVADSVAAAERLDAELERDGDEPAWDTSAETPTMERAITANFRLGDEGRLSIETNSIARRDSALGLVARLLGPAEVLEDTRLPLARARSAQHVEDLVDLARRALGVDDIDDIDDIEDIDEDEDEDEDAGDDDGDQEGDDDGDQEAMAAALATITEAYEDRWLDQPVPVLGGRTPREAAADADDAVRADLVTILAEMQDRGPGFDAERLRNRLGLSVH